MMNLKNGDKIICLDEVDGNQAIIGRTGTIIEFDLNGDALIEFDRHIGGHDGHGKIRAGYAWYVPPELLINIHRLIEYDKFMNSSL